MNFDSFFADILAAVIAGVILTFLFFIAKEKIFPLPALSGRWYFETETLKTTYNPFSGMVLRYVAMLWQEGPVIRGTVEKIYENSSTGEREYSGTNRTRGTLEGYIHKFYLSKDHIHIHLVEEGQERTSTVFFDLACDKHSRMSGTFQSMAADQSGRIRWQKEPWTTSGLKVAERRQSL